MIRTSGWLMGLLITVFASAALLAMADQGNDSLGEDSGVAPDMLTPAYYHAETESAFRVEVDRFIASVREVDIQHPLSTEAGGFPTYSIPEMGAFGALKGPNQDVQYHPAIDLYVEGRQSTVNLYAAHDGVVRTMRDLPKYRHAITITRDVFDSDGALLGKLVTLYGHVDLDLDTASGLLLNGQAVAAGDLISRHLYAGTMGGPHLHFEIRYYRPGDGGDEEFYGGRAGPHGNPLFTEPSAGTWSYGFWHPTIGYGYADPRNHGIGE